MFCPMMNVLFNIFLGTQKEDLLKEYYFMWDQKRLKFLMELPTMRQSKNSNGGRCFIFSLFSTLLYSSAP
jgi:hypothetical protein